MKKIVMTVALLASCGMMQAEMKMDVPVNPELHYDNFTFKNMSEADAKTTGLNKLTTFERIALENWVSQCGDETEKNEEMPPEPENSQNSMTADAAIAQAESVPEKTLPQNTATENFKSHKVMVKEVLLNGRFVVVDNGTVYRVPGVLQKKTVSWKNGDVINIEPTPKPRWVRLVNPITNDHVLARIETQGADAHHADAAKAPQPVTAPAPSK
ncbi:MAG TPA: hypothetical protein VN457_05715 [Chlamydiales bacterium]|nr:hypothetical protein [Chlamydiales bacterium]